MSNTSNTIIFRHPDIKMRIEAFGGLARANGELYMLGHDEFFGLSVFCGYASRKEVEKKLDKVLVDKFLAAGLFLEINQEEADKVLR